MPGGFALNSGARVTLARRLRVRDGAPSTARPPFVPDSVGAKGGVAPLGCSTECGCVAARDACCFGYRANERVPDRRVMDSLVAGSQLIARTRRDA